MALVSTLWSKWVGRKHLTQPLCNSNFGQTEQGSATRALAPNFHSTVATQQSTTSTCSLAHRQPSAFQLAFCPASMWPTGGTTRSVTLHLKNAARRFQQQICNTCKQMFLPEAKPALLHHQQTRAPREQNSLLMRQFLICP